MKRFRKLNPEFELSCVCNIIHILLHTRRSDAQWKRHVTRQDKTSCTTWITTAVTTLHADLWK